MKRSIAILMVALGCGNVDVVGSVGGAAGMGGTGGSAGTGGGTQAAPICGGRIAEQTFRWALCACGRVQVHSLRTDSIDAVSGATSSFGAAAGTNVAFTPGATANVGGSLLVAGDLSLPDNSRVAGDLAVAGMLGGGSGSNVSRDAWLEGPVNLPMNGLSIGRDLYTPLPQWPRGVSVRGRMVQRNFTMSQPCDCGASATVDIAAIVAGVAQHNDDATIQLAPDRLAAVATADDLTLPAGQFHLTSIGGSGQATIHLSGRTVVTVDGDVAIAHLTIDVGTSGELDLFVGGSLLDVGGLNFGNSQRPAASRMYVAGSQTIVLPGGQVDFVGNLYAPAAQISSTANQSTVRGALFGGSVATNDLSIHYDGNIGSASAACPTAGAACSRCQDCTGGTACVGGTCGACRTDADCCAPLSCSSGRCQPLHP